MLKKSLLLSVASLGALTLSSVATRSAQAQRYVSGSATVVNITGSISSVGGEVGGIRADGVNVQPNYNLGSFFGVSSFVNNLQVNAVVNLSAPPITITEVVANTLNSINSLGILPSIPANEQNLSAYVAIVRAAGGNDGLE